jgi:hypothetical protein
MSITLGSVEKNSSTLPTTMEEPIKPKETKDTKLRESVLDSILSDSTLTLEERLGAIVVNSMEVIAEDHWKRMEGYSKEFSLLNTGIFYQDGFCEALQKVMQSTKSDKTKKVVADLFGKLEKNGAFYHGAAPTSHFTIPSDPTFFSGKVPLKYVLRDKSITPSAALRAILHPKSRVFLSCAEPCQLAFMEALLEILGEKKFNYLFAFDSSTPFFVGATPSSYEHFMYLLIEDRAPTGPIQQGEWLFFQGAQVPHSSGRLANLYSFKHLNGCGGNWNAISKDKSSKKIEMGTYLGLGLNPKGASHTEIEETLVNEYNKPPIGFQGLSKEVAAKQKADFDPQTLAQAETLKTHKMTMTQFRYAKGGKALIVRKLNVHRIKQLIDASPEEGRLLLQAWKEAHQKIRMEQLGEKIKERFTK